MSLISRGHRLQLNHPEKAFALLKAMFNKAVQWGFARMENPVSKVSYYPER
jgi:hypothetical protein